jgi:pyruvate/2-oxoglutarate dehydrogenase complex dihydrolipoamide acyltransferase (E2) component
MPTEVILPKWGLTMEDGALVAWLKQPGDRVEAGEVLAEVETEKVTNALEAPVSGIISRLLVAEGTEEIEVGTVLCIIEEDDHD